MANKDSFYDEVFGDSDEDPLLSPERSTPNEDAFDEKRPSWTSGPSSESPSSPDPDRKEFLLDPRENTEEDLRKLNEVLGQGWKLVRISLSQPNGEQAAPGDARQIVATLQADSPRSLFDFGG